MKADILSLSGVPCRYQCWTGWPDDVTDDVRQHLSLTTLYLILEPIMKSVLWDNYSCKWPNTSVNRKNVFCGTSERLCVQYYVSFLVVAVVVQLYPWYKINCLCTGTIIFKLVQKYYNYYWSSTFVSQVMICTMYPFQMSLADAKLSFPVHSLTMKRSGEDTSQECKKVHVRLHN